MNYSRIYQFTPSGAEAALTLEAALPGSNDDEAHQILFDSLRSAFHMNARRQLGFFDSALPNNALATGASDFQNQNIDADTLGLRLAEHIKQKMDGGDKQHSWYLWFIIEQSGDDQILYLFLLKHDETHHISAQRTVTASGIIQPNRMQYGAKLNLAEWQSAQSKTYLSYLAPKNQLPITLAWNELIGFSENVDRAAQTEGFLTTLERYAEELPPEKEQDYRARVMDYCLDQDRAGEPVDIKVLSQRVDEDAPEALLNFYTEHVEEPPPALYADRKQLKRYTRLYGRDNDLSIGFSTLMLGRNIIYDESTETLIIRAIPKALKSQLARHVKKPE